MCTSTRARLSFSPPTSSAFSHFTVFLCSALIDPPPTTDTSIPSHRQCMVYVRKNYTVANYPEELKRKEYLLKHFESYITGKLYRDYEYTFLDLQRIKCIHFVQKYLRMKHVIVLKSSYDVLQVRAARGGSLFYRSTANARAGSSTFTTTRRSFSWRRASLSHTSTRTTCSHAGR